MRSDFASWYCCNFNKLNVVLLGKSVIGFVYQMLMVKYNHAMIKGTKLLECYKQVHMLIKLLAHLVFTWPQTQDKFINTGSVRHRPRPGQPKKSIAQDDHSIRLRVLRNRNITALTLEVALLVIDVVVFDWVLQWIWNGICLSLIISHFCYQ